MQILRWVDPADPVVQTWPKDGFVVIRSIRIDHLAFFTSTVMQALNSSAISNLLGPYEEVHVALIDDGTHYTDTEYYQRANEEGLDLPTSYWLGTPARQEKKAPAKKVKAVQPRDKARGQTKSGRRKSKARLDR